ncbi:hypothetical protein N431DRAFT_430617 [Stipitochalara longipes BDJ]|nr:hypothetical protein N431DRAFT_430617 [Stipitochalara longipes BDJ]
MPSLLTLPRELLHKVLELVISSFIPAPQDISDASNRATLRDFHIDRRYNNFHQGCVLYIEHTKQPDTTSLLLVSRQLYIETLAVLRILPTKHSYILDVIIGEEKNLWPTWLYVPELTTRVDKVYTTFRSIGFPTKRNSLFLGGDRGPPRLTWALYNLIERFLRVGPVGRQPGRNDKHISIKELVIDVLTPDVPPEMIAPAKITPFGGGVLRQRRRGNYSAEDEPQVMRHPKSTAAYICSNLRTLLCGAQEIMGDYGCLVYERIGTIKVLVDGEPFSEVRAEWDLAEDLAKMRYNDRHRRNEEREEFMRWKERAHDLRVEFGLPVKPHVVAPEEETV